MARLQGDEKKYLQVSPKIIARLIVSLIFMSCCLNILYLTQLQESEDAMEVVSGVRQLQKATAKSTAAKDPPEPSNASSSQVPDISTRGKERILKLLRDAGITDLDNTTVAALPTWNEISQLYGSQSSIVYGLDTCAHYREMIPASERRTAVAGLFNTGTNAIAWSLSHNIKSSRTNYWQVPWGKHRLANVKWTHTVTGLEQANKTHILPIVIIKDPLTWLQSMCRHPYSAQWRQTSQHCPNLVPNSLDYLNFPVVTKKQNRTVPVKIKFSKESVEHWDSLIDVWSDWYHQYLTADYPRLMVRFEDFLFAPDQLLQQIANCVGGELTQPVRFQIDSSKPHGSQTDLVHAFIKYGRALGRTHNLTVDDWRYVADHVNPDLMRIFRYKIDPPTALLETTRVQ